MDHRRRCHVLHLARPGLQLQSLRQLIYPVSRRIRGRMDSNSSRTRTSSIRLALLQSKVVPAGRKEQERKRRAWHLHQRPSGGPRRIGNGRHLLCVCVATKRILLPGLGGGSCTCHALSWSWIPRTYNMGRESPVASARHSHSSSRHSHSGGKESAGPWQFTHTHSQTRTGHRTGDAKPQPAKTVVVVARYH